MDAPTDPLIYVSRNGETYGPYSKADAYKYLKTDELLPNDSAREGDGPWQPLQEVLFPTTKKTNQPAAQLQRPPTPTSAQQVAPVRAPYKESPNLEIQENQKPLSALDIIKLQSEMKSTAVAVLLAVFIPYIGSFYSSPLFGVFSIFVALASIPIAANPHLPGVGILILSVLYIAGIFYSISEVKKFNKKLLNKNT